MSGKRDWTSQVILSTCEIALKKNRNKLLTHLTGAGPHKCYCSVEEAR